jgi:hypothetical protein
LEKVEEKNEMFFSRVSGRGCYALVLRRLNATTVATMPSAITVTAVPRSAVPERPLPYVGIELLAPDVVGPDPVEPTLTGMVVECDAEPPVSVIVTV